MEDYNKIQYNEKLDFYRLNVAQSRSAIVLDTTFKDDSFIVSSGIVNYANDVVKTKKDMGKRTYDLLAFNDGMNKVISDKLLNLLIENEVIGFKTYPVDIKGVKEKYHGLQVIGKSGKYMKPEKKEDNDDYSFKGVKFDPETWDGSDIFFPEGTTALTITPRIKKILEENNITNIEIEHISDCLGFY
ncbi:hypothetical protein [Aquimarina algiphila]|uniref:Uncharacterized protein n=1 Tax=Aquimarina algiphila TaxID=2047982 RepID=A0A554VEG3_9FLAO|nr:hypothetical protein [Aquimarina algiphila]TSE05418.1 hypothetical protein FOF46_22915 [Aquimarina algiphila]